MMENIFLILMLCGIILLTCTPSLRELQSQGSATTSLDSMLISSARDNLFYYCACFILL